MLFIFQLLAIVCWKINGVLAKEFNGEYASLFTPDEIETITSRTTRKEIRDLSSDEWQRIVDAMWVMKTTSQSDGEALYGSKFTNYDVFVCQHSHSVLANGEDVGHRRTSFVTFHRALEVAFEQSLHAINPDIEGAPYWDFRLDIDDLEGSIMFTDEYFGSIGGNSDENHIVTDGKFAYWPVASNRDAVTCTGRNENPFGYLRSTLNVLDQPFVVRYGTHHCKFDDYSAALSDYNKCLNTITNGDVSDFLTCFDYTTHAYAHHFVGGTSLLTSDETDSADCVQWFQSYNSYSECFECPVCETGVDIVSNCFCEVSSDAVDSDSCDSVSTDDFSALLSTAQMFGDFDDLPTSTNDPIFFFHHLNIDRYVMQWQLMNYDYDSNYYNFPIDGEENGANLDDICGPEWPFTNLWDDSGEAYTNRDIWDNTQMLVNSYTYDTIVDMITVDDGISEAKSSFLECTALICLVAYALIFATYVVAYLCKDRFIRPKIGSILETESTPLRQTQIPSN